MSDESPMMTILLSQGKSALVDDDDYDFLSASRWYAWQNNFSNHIWYALRNEGKITIRMHRLVALRMGIDSLVDHCNGDGLDNRRLNLRPATYGENIAAASFHHGRSRFRGVSILPKGRWRAYIKKDQRQIWLGAFNSEIDAALAYDRAALKMWGEFASLNFAADTKPIPYILGGGRLCTEQQ